MKPKQYLKLPINEVPNQLKSDFEELLVKGKGYTFIKGFDNALNALRMKWESIKRLSNNEIQEKTWKYFYATVICPMREELFPQEMNKRREDARLKREYTRKQKEWENAVREDWFKQRQEFVHNLFASAILREWYLDNRRKNAFSVLNISEDSTKAEVMIAFRKLAKKYHPDQGGNVVKFNEIVEAKEECLLHVTN